MDEIEIKRKMVLDSLGFYVKERNIAAFKLSAARLKRQLAQDEESEAAKSLLKLNERLMVEFENNLHLLKDEDKKQFGSQEIE